MANPFFTIGHSTRPISEFVDLLLGEQVRLVVDVRTVPRSRTNPQFNRDALPDSLAAHGIGYEHIADLGGLRGKHHSGETSRNTFWQNSNFRNYADHALTPEFRAGLDRLRALGDERRVAIMCAEAVWWRFHRRIIADHLIGRGESVMHILGRGWVDRARLSAAARLSPAELLIDDAQRSGTLPI